jgi:hypothetical protein
MTPSALSLARLAIAFVFLVVIAGAGVWSTVIYFEVVDKVNARLTEADKFELLWWGPFKRARLHREYRRLFPDGDDLKRVYRLAAIMFAAVLGLLITLGFP